MVKKLSSIVAGAMVVVGVIAIAPSAHAAVPTISAALSGGGDNVLLNVNGDANSSVILNYLSTSGATKMSALGTTNSSGFFTITLSSATYGIASGSLFNVTVNNQRSDSKQWPYTTTVTSGTGLVSLSQTTATLTVGQSVTVTATNSSGGALYLSSNSSPSVANVTINGNQIGITGNVGGSTSITVCSLANSASCASIAVTVQSTNVTPITFSQNNVSLGMAQNLLVNIGGGTGMYSISSNSNPTLIQASLTGSSVNLYSNGSSGTASITACSTNLSSCGVINVTAVAAGTASTLSFSPANPSITPGNITPVTVGGGTGTYYISSNTSTNTVQANLVGNTLTLFGNAIGTATLSICSNSGGCGTVVATVAAPGTSQISVGQTNVSLSAGQTYNDALSGLGGYYISVNTNPSIASASISGNSVVVTAGSMTGTTNISVCQSNSQCATVYVTVSSASASTSATTGAITATYVVTVGQGINVMLAGGTTPYSASAYPSGVVSTKLTGGTVLTISGVGSGTASVSVCGATGGCTTINVIAVTTSGTTPGASASNSAHYRFENPMKLNAAGAEVRELQKRLTEEGVYYGPISGTFGPLTEAAVKKYQKAHGLQQLGNVGPGTRAQLNGE